LVSLGVFYFIWDFVSLSEGLEEGFREYCFFGLEKVVAVVSEFFCNLRVIFSVCAIS
jgi:hypothetical protein